MTDQQELEAVCKCLNLTEAQFDKMCEVAYKKVIKKRVQQDNPKPIGNL